MQIQEGPLAGLKGVQTTIGEYTIDNSEPVQQGTLYPGMLCTTLASSLSKQATWTLEPVLRYMPLLC